jgi:hypothetical protein
MADRMIEWKFEERGERRGAVKEKMKGKDNESIQKAHE